MGVGEGEGEWWERESPEGDGDRNQMVKLVCERYKLIIANNQRHEHTRREKRRSEGVALTLHDRISNHGGRR